MIFTIAVLIGCVWAGGLSVKLLKGETMDIQLPLVFAGSFLFAVTIIHIIPELFSLSARPKEIGVFVLIGFFLQRMLEYFSRGVEHGHAHKHGIESNATKMSVLIALIIHSVLEGSLLTHSSPFHDQHESYSLLVGIVLHKIPAAIALTIVLWESKSKWWLLLLFSIASPVGLLLSSSIELSGPSMVTLFAIVCGSFLYISTTIFVETSPEHSFGFNKTVVSLIGAGLAILAEYMM
jgi:zinc transporter ZupT